MTDPRSIDEAVRALNQGTVTSKDLTAACLDRIDASTALGAFVTINRDAAMAAATAADVDRAAGRIHGALQGIPVAIKDVFATRDAPTRANSRAIEPGWGHGVDAEAVARLRAAGAVLVGKTTTNEYACGPPDETKGFPIPRNPWHLQHTPDGSSSGSGIAVAAGLALGALGTDTGGSVRGPAAANGITGLKPTYGIVPRHGVIPLSDSLDTVGVLARSAHDCALLLAALTRSAAPAREHGALRIGVTRSGYFCPEGIDPGASEAVESFVATLSDTARGTDVRAVHVPRAGLAADANQVIIAAEGFARHRDRLRVRWSDYGVHTRQYLASGAFLGAAAYLAAQRFRILFRSEIAALFRDIDLLVTPSSAAPAPRLDSRGGPLGEKRNFDSPWNLIGLPAMAVPCGFDPAGMPLSVQLVGRAHADYTVLAVAEAFQARTDWHLHMPPTPPAHLSRHPDSDVPQE
jgi:aspartyl-tRNA(Asn)/glutamyl-tRNA(Gln) amidotransferase subunit A